MSYVTIITISITISIKVHNTILHFQSTSNDLAILHLHHEIHIVTAILLFIM